MYCQIITDINFAQACQTLGRTRTSSPARPRTFCSTRGMCPSKISCWAWNPGDQNLNTRADICIYIYTYWQEYGSIKELIHCILFALINCVIPSRLFVGRCPWVRRPFRAPAYPCSGIAPIGSSADTLAAHAYLWNCSLSQLQVDD